LKKKKKNKKKKKENGWICVVVGSYKTGAAM
jgi:hypothetical protein